MDLWSRRRDFLVPAPKVYPLPVHYADIVTGHQISSELASLDTGGLISVMRLLFRMPGSCSDSTAIV